jgi:hypothetical protein
MTHPIAELDMVELTEDVPCGLVEGARGAVVSIHGADCTVEFVGPDGYTIGLFELPLRVVEWVDPLMRYETVAREE